MQQATLKLVGDCLEKEQKFFKLAKVHLTVLIAPWLWYSFAIGLNDPGSSFHANFKVTPRTSISISGQSM